MTQRNRFCIHNGSSRTLQVGIEPEGALFPLGEGEQVFVNDVFKKAPVTVKFSSSNSGEPIVSIWPGDGDVTVEKDGVSLLDLMEKEVDSRHTEQVSSIH